MAANCAAFAGTPGGAGGSTCCAIPSNRAPASKLFWRSGKKHHSEYIHTAEQLHHDALPSNKENHDPRETQCIKFPFKAMMYILKMNF
jgi:hypothetical protein